MTKKNYVYKNKENIQEIIGWTTPKLHQASECYVAFKAFDPSYGKLRLKKISSDISRANEIRGYTVKLSLSALPRSFLKDGIHG